VERRGVRGGNGGVPESRFCSSRISEAGGALSCRSCRSSSSSKEM
jgi:hypothetical protein